MKKKIEVFLRHCYYSRLQELPDRIRPEWFNKIKVFKNFKNTLDPDLVNYTIIYDEFYGSIDRTFLNQEENVEVINHGSECDSFLSTLDIIQSKNFDDDQIIYFLEDDYVHRPGWCNVLLEAFEIENSKYATLYDFNYFDNQDFRTKIFTTMSSHWRAVPATTNTFACRYKTLIEDLEIHKKFSSSDAIKEENGYYFSRDYEKFWELQKQNRFVLSPMPGWSTHCDKSYLSPVIDWESVLKSSYSLEKSDHEKTFNYSQYQ